MQFETSIDDNTTLVDLDDGMTKASVNGKDMQLNWIVQEHGRRLLRIGKKIYKINNVEIDGKQIQFSLNGNRYRVVVKDEQDLLLEKLGFKTDEAVSAGTIEAPMPGKLLEILVDSGQQVELGQPVAILEAMKMENELKSSVSGTITDIHVEPGDSVEKNQKLISIEPSG